MSGSAAVVRSMTDVSVIIEQARLEGRDLATALRIARATLHYVSSPDPDANQRRALRALDERLAEIAGGRNA